MKKHLYADESSRELLSPKFREMVEKVAEHGETVRQEQKTKETCKAQVNADISAAMETSSSLNTGILNSSSLFLP